MILSTIASKVILKARRYFNKKVAYSFPPVADGWKKKELPILPETAEGSYFDPYALFVDQKIVVYVSKRNSGSISRFILDDHFELREEISVLEGRKNSWDEVVNRACVIKYHDEFLMWYTGQSGINSFIGFARSGDGVTFKREGDTPVITPSLSYEKRSVMNPCVLFNEKKNLFQMWYSAGEQYEPDVICYAESSDGVTWHKNNGFVLEKGKQRFDKYKVGGCDVHIEGNKYVMLYIGYENIDVARICYAESKDGITWYRGKYPIISPSKMSWDADAVYKPSYVKKDEQEIILYNGRKSGTELIGVAIRSKLVP